MKYIGRLVRPGDDQLSVSTMQYYSDLFQTKFSRHAFPTEEVRDWMTAYRMTMDQGVKVFLVFAAPETQEENDRFQEITGRRHMGKPVAAVHLTNFEGLTARAHFSLHPNSTRCTEAMVDAGQQFLLQLFSAKRDRVTGVPFLQTAIGITPVYNKPALRYAKSIGFVPACVIQSAMRHFTHKYIDATMSIATAESVNATRQKTES